VVNPDGGTGIRVNGVTYSSEPTWVTSSPLSNQAANTEFNVTLSATSATSYAVAAGSTLPTGTTLAANGYFYGTVTVGLQTTYSFDVVATDAENQDSSKTFQVTVTVAPPTRLYAFGKDFGQGRLGLNDTVLRSSPTQVGTNTTWSAISASPVSGSFATKTDGTLWAWGANGNGHLGLNNSGVYRSSPTQVGTNTNWSGEIISSRGFAAAIKTGGTLWLWGAGSYGSLGQNDTVARSSPTQVGTGTDWSKIALSMSATAAIKTNGTLWTWGSGTAGQLGNSNSAGVSSPVQIGSNTNWNLISGNGALGSYRFSAIKTDGTLWVWGDFNDGALGVNDTNNRNSPTQLGTGTDWSKIFTGNHTMAIKTNGTLWAWGRNSNGQLGFNDRVNRSSPVQVGAATNWSLCSISNYNTMAIKTDGTLWAWGGSSPAGESGHLGLNSIIDRSSPVQVGTATNWSRVTSGNQFTLAITSN
jgi:alpha-tubulin suppressor-like RCC1 family protein